MAYLSQIKTGGKQYIYLTEYCGIQAYSSKTEKRVYSFGQSWIAILKMKKWLENFEDFPEKLKEIGYGKNDLKEWIQTIESGITKNGRTFEVDTQKRAIF